ncbi:MAG TPA: hypothetical protein GXX51_09130 [Firmicutes bacterium]|nr:hypothetical protein [Bacillota bacterium]
MNGDRFPFKFSFRTPASFVFAVMVIMFSIIVATSRLDVADLGGKAPDLNLSLDAREFNTYPYYEIYDQDTLEFLMVVDFPVYPGDEFLTPDNRLFHINYVEENRAYAAFVRKVRLIKPRH